jgi:hypothetical protein
LRQQIKASSFFILQFDGWKMPRLVLLFPRKIDVDKGIFFRYRAASPGSVLPAIVVVLIVPSLRDGLASGALRPTSRSKYHRAWIVQRVQTNL